MWRISALDREGREVGHFDLSAGELTIGRDTDRQLILPSASVSRRHARVIMNGAQPMIVDEGSSNGVVVDGVRIAAPTVIGPMSRIDVAEFRLTVVNLDQPAAQPMPAAQSMAGGDSIKLVGEGGPYDGRVFDVPLQPCTVGRALDNALVFDDPSLSRKHAQLQRESPGRFTVEDLGSSNGTYVNGRKMGRGSAGAGDAIQFGDLVFRVEAHEYSGTRSVEAGSGRGQWIAVFAGGAVTLVVMVGMLVALAKKPPLVQAPGKDAIAKYSAKADLHLRQGRALYRERKYTEAKQELDAALDADPANMEARRLSRLASRGPDDDRLLGAVNPSLRIADRKALENVARVYDEITDGSTQKQQLQSKLLTVLEQFGLDRCAKRQWSDCAWATCKAYEIAPREAPPDGRVGRALGDAEKKLAHDKTYSRLPLSSVIYWERLRTEIGRYGDGVHELGPPADRARIQAAEARLQQKLPPALAELYRSFDGVKLFTDSFVIRGAGELERQGELIRLGDALGAPLFLDENGRVYEADEAGDRLLAGSDVARFIDAVLAREKLVVDREGEFKDVFVDGGELGDEVRHKRARAGLKIDPDSAAWRLEAAELAFEDGQEAEARVELERAVAADEHAGAAWALLGGLHARAGRLDEAAAAFARAANASRDRERRAARWAEAAHAAQNSAVRQEHARASREADEGAVARWLEEAERRLTEEDSDGALHLAQLADAVDPEGAAAELVKRARVKSKLKVI